MHRHARQTLLAEIGPMGQAAISRRRVDVRLGGLAAEVAVRYLAGAGVAFLNVRDAHLAALAGDVDRAVETAVDATLPLEPGVGYDLADPTARDVACGARFALGELKAALDAEAR
ncbi:MAG TPA: hypothetical protein VKU41_24825 [Polyangiaceae bacterium]|nr:hypothetical protein [Polyangiaceae bacterium]